MAADQALQHRADRHFSLVTQRRLQRVFREWACLSHVNASISLLDKLLRPCKDAFCKPAHERSPEEVSAVLQLLQPLQQFEGLCREAQLFVALHAQLLVLQEEVELCGLLEKEPPCMYSVLCGSVLQLHGSLDSPELQQLLHTARAELQADKAAACEGAGRQQQLCKEAAAAAAPVNQQNTAGAAAINSSNGSGESTGGVCLADVCDRSCSTESMPSWWQRSCSSCRGSEGGGLSPGLNLQPGVWQRVMAAVSNRGKPHSSGEADLVQQWSSHATPALQPLQQQQHAAHQIKHKTGAAAAAWRTMPAATALDASAAADVTAAGADSSLSLTVASRGQSFCVSKFVCGSPSAESMLLAAKTPSSCVAAAAAPNCVAGVLVVSRPVYVEALRLHQEVQLARVLGLLSRIPALRHAPLKELTRLGAHLRESTYSKGQLILRQGQEASDTYIHFVLKGTVSLTYSAAVSQTAARAAARASMNGAQLAIGGPQSTGLVAQGLLASPGAAAAAGRFSGLAQVLRLEQTCFAPPAVLATRGPGAVLGDDAVRDKRLAVGVVAAEEGVTTLRVAPQKFLSTLDPLTLRLFTRLRQQEEEVLQVALTAAAAAAAAQTAPGQQQPGELQRLAVLTQVYNKDIPSTLLRPGAAGTPAAAASEGKQRPAWHSLRGKATTPEPEEQKGTPRAHRHTGAGISPHQAGQQASKQRQCEGVCPPGQQTDAAWEAQLPAGMTADKCVGLPQTASVKQFVELIRDVAVYRKMHMRAMGASTAAVTACAATAAARAAKTSLAGTTATSLLAPPQAVLEPVVAAAAAAAAAMAAYGGSCSSSRHTELQEGCCVAVLRLQVLPGQAPAGMAALSGVLDDVYSACGAVAYDEGLQLVRWGAFTFILLAPLDPGVPEAAGVQCAADVLLSTAARLSGLMLRAEGSLPLVRLAAGLALGSCFLDYEAGTFVSAVSGRAFTAAEQLCEAACSIPTWSLPFSHSPGASPNTCQAVLLVSDGVASILQSGCGYNLQALPGSLMLLSARAALAPHGPAVTGASSGRQQQQSHTSRQTLGPGRHTVLGLGVGMGLPAVTPKTPTHRRRAGSVFGGARVHRRRQIRRKFEAMASFLAGAGDALPPPPDFMLTQPPPPAVTALGDGPAAGSAAATAVGANSSAGRARAVNFAAGTSSSSSSGGGPGGGKARPKLSISLDAAGVAGLDEGLGFGPGSPGSPNKPSGSGLLGGLEGQRKAATSPAAGRAGRKGVAGKLTWAAGGASPAAQQPRASSLPVAAAATVAEACAAVANDSTELGLKQGSGAAARSNMQAAEQSAGRRTVSATHTGAKHASLSGATATTLRSSGGLAGHLDVHGKLHAEALISSCGSNGGHAAAANSSAGSSSSHMRARQQVWQEVQAMRAAASLSGASGAAAGLGPAKLSASGGSWCTHARALLGDGVGPARPSSPNTMLTAALLHGRPGSPQPQPFAAATAAAATALPAPVFDGWYQHTQYGSTRASAGIEKAVCFLTPRTQAAAAAATAAATTSAAAATASATVPPAVAWDINGHRTGQSIGPTSTAGGQQGQQGSVCGSSAGGNSSHEGSQCHSGDGSSEGAKQQQRQQLSPEQQQLLVHAACKSLGSAAAAEAFVAAQPADTESLNCSASGLVQLPSLHGLGQLETLTASFNKLSSLVGLRPANQDAMCAAAAAAAAADVEELQQARLATATPSTSSRPSSRHGFGVHSLPRQEAAALVATAGSNAQQQQQLKGLCSRRHSTAAPTTPPRPHSADMPAHGAAVEGTAAYQAAYEQHVLQLTQLLVPPGLKSMLPPSLLQLSLAHNQVQEVPYELPSALPALTLLDLSHNRLSALPQTLGALSCLKVLLVSHNQLVQLPGSISRLQQLRTLHAGHNELQQLPAGFTQLSSLSSLHLQHNQLQRLPEGCCQLTGLCSLGLGFNKLQQLPRGLLVGLSGLQALDLSGNGLDDAAVQLAAEAPAAPAATAAGQLVVTNNATDSSDNSSSRAAAGACVDYAGAGSHACEAAPTSSSRPGSAAQGVEGSAGQVVLPSLLALDVSHNSLTQLPLWFPSTLVWLIAAHNSITAVPSVLCEQLAGSLQGLELQHNSLQDLPSELKAMSKLQLLSLAGNPGLHPDVVDRGSGLVWAYRWLADKKQAVASAAIKASHMHKYH